MPLQNRVTPTGEIIATPARGTMMGNRGGCLHLPGRILGARRWVSRQWICCRLAFKDRHREVMTPGRYTELFFLDEVTALAAGHRPCFECRREEALAFARLWAQAAGRTGRASASEMDAVLHAERLAPDGAKRTHPARAGALPAGTFILHAGRPALVARHREEGLALLAWHPEGYRPILASPGSDEMVETLTPPSIIAVMRQGYWPPLPAITSA